MTAGTDVCCSILREFKNCSKKPIEFGIAGFRRNLFK